MISVPSENMLALRKLTDELCFREADRQYHDIVIKLKKIVTDGGDSIKTKRNNKDKIKCYENMCVIITDLLKDIKI